MSDSLLIPCPHCDGLNRLPATRLGDAPKCGRCKQQVLLGQSFELNERNYASQIKGDLPLLIDVWADWCGPCKSFAPTFEQAARQLEGRCRLAKLDSEANRTCWPVGYPFDSQPDPVQERPRSQPPGGRVSTAVAAGVATQPRDLSVFFEQRVQLDKLLGQLVPWLQVNQR